MEPIPCHKHSNESFQLEVLLEKSELIIYIVASPQVDATVFKGIFQYDDLPQQVRNCSESIEDVFDLFSKDCNFKVNPDAGNVGIILRSIVKNQIVQNLLIIQLKKEVKEISHEDLVHEVKDLRNDLKLLRQRLNTMEQKNLINPEKHIKQGLSDNERIQILKQLNAKIQNDDKHIQIKITTFFNEKLQKLEKQLQKFNEKQKVMRQDFQKYMKKPQDFSFAYEQQKLKVKIEETKIRIKEFKQNYEKEKKTLFQKYPQQKITQTKDKYRGNLQSDNFLNIYEWADGHRYEGGLKNFQFSGAGIKFLQNGQKIELYYKGSDIVGFLYKNNNLKYEGELNEALKFHGRGILHYSKTAYYKGQFLNGERSGKGTHMMDKGEYYMGQFKSNKRHGKGKFIDEDGDIQQRVYCMGQITSRT